MRVHSLQAFHQFSWEISFIKYIGQAQSGFIHEGSFIKLTLKPFVVFDGLFLQGVYYVLLYDGRNLTMLLQAV